MIDKATFIARAWVKFHRFCNTSGPIQDQNKEHYKGLDACWEWTGCIGDDGYGKTHAFGKIMRAHRLSYILHIGEIEEGLMVLHRCDNTKCLNPSHLFLGTGKDNGADMVMKERQAKGLKNGAFTCPEKVLRGDRHPARLHPETRPRGDKHGLYLHPERRPRGSRHGMALLNEAQVLEIRKLIKLRVTQKRISEQFNVSESTISMIAINQIWRHVQDEDWI